jgi:hypothetical protein
MTRGARYRQVMKTFSLAFATILALAAGACVDAAPDVPTSGRTPVPGLDHIATTPGTIAPDVQLILESGPDADPCVDEGCPDGLFCDWVQGCTSEVLFCCVDEMCGEGRFCDFDAGGVCADLP